jgi:hypothetical protein
VLPYFLCCDSLLAILVLVQPYVLFVVFLLILLLFVCMLSLSNSICKLGCCSYSLLVVRFGVSFLNNGCWAVNNWAKDL